MSGDFAGARVVVTGAARGIGAAVAQAFADRGARVAGLDLTAGAPDTADRLALAVDVGDAEGMGAAMDRVAGTFGGIDILVNNAGIGRPNGLQGMALADWEQTLRVNLTGALNAIQAALPYLKRSAAPAVVNVASIAGKRMSYHGGPDYTASKAGLLGLTRHAAFELAGHRIRVNAVCPGPVLTPLIEGITTEAERAHTASLMPLGRWVLPEDVAQAVLFLAGPGASVITGATLDVDAGFLVGNGAPYAEYARKRGLDGAGAGD